MYGFLIRHEFQKPPKHGSCSRAFRAPHDRGEQFSPCGLYRLREKCLRFRVRWDAQRFRGIHIMGSLTAPVGSSLNFMIRPN